MTKLYLLYSRYLSEEKITHEYLMIITSSKQQLNTQIKNLFTKNPDEWLRLEVWEHTNDEYLQVLSKDLARGDYID